MDWTPEITTLTDQLSRHYVLPDVAERVNEVLRRHLANGVYRDLADGQAFADTVSQDLGSVNGDPHLFVQYSEAEIPEGADELVDGGALRAERAALTGHGIAKVERLPGNVGLLDIRKLYAPEVGGAGEAVVAALNLVAGADALLLDLRRNTGGEPAMVALLCGYLFDERTQLSSLYFPAGPRTVQWWTPEFVPGPAFGGTKPLYVLSSRQTFSGGEALSYDLQQAGRATVVGESSAGGPVFFHYPYRVSAHLWSAVPSGYPVHPVTGTNWGEAGVRPDVETTADAAFDTAYRLALRHVLGLGEAGARGLVAEQARAALAELG